MLTLVQLFWLSVFASTHLLKVSEASLPYVRFAGSSTVFPVTNAWSNQLLTEYDFTIEGGGSSTGAKRVCLPRDDPDHVDVGAMSRNWKDSEAVRLDDTYTLECTKESWNGTKVRVPQLQVATDGLAVVVKLNGAGHRCLTSPEVGGLTLAQLRWIYSDWSDSDLADDKDGRLNMVSVAPNDDGDGIKEWSDLHEGCDQVPINPYGAGDQSGTHDFFGEVVLCEKCFTGATGYTPEYFKTCNLSAVHHLEQMSTTDAAAYITSGRDRLGTPNCYAPTEDDEHIYNWVMADEGGIGYFGFAYYSKNSATLTAIRIAGDTVNGIGDTAAAKIAPTSYSITDGSYSFFTRNLYMNVDNHAWDLVRRFMLYGFSDPGQTLVANFRKDVVEL
jgi:ABC-type phosphate transport system substrate-binding protein